MGKCILRNALVDCGVGAALLFAAGCGGEDSCGANNYPSPPAGTSGLVYVSASCSGGDGDGTAESPFATLQAAVDAAPPGAAVLIGPGTYTDALTLTRDISLIGSDEGTPADAAPVVIAGAASLTVTGGKALIRGLKLVRTRNIGTWVKAGELVIDASQILETSANEAGNFGYGVVASDGATLTLQNSVVARSAAVGVLVRDARGIILQNKIDDNAGGGVRIERAIDQAEVRQNELSANVQLGIGVFSSRAIILQNEIRGTRLDSNDVGDGILVSGLVDMAGVDLGPSDVVVDDNLLEGSERVGILCHGLNARGIILQNNTVLASGARAVSAGAGIWLQAGAGSGPESKIVSNRLFASKFVGVGLTGDTHGIILQRNEIRDTLPMTVFEGAEEIEIGDGINLFDGASAVMTHNTVTGSGRFGLIIDNADAGNTEVRDNTFSDNESYGIILQNQGARIDVQRNTIEGTGGNTLENPGIPFPTQSSQFDTAASK